MSPDGRLVALVAADGLARMVEVESQQVIAVLASPRGMTDAVAYEPHGRGVLTMARAQREVTLWRASDWTPIWRVTLPGTPYYHMYNGGLAFAPDGRSAVVSPGSDTFLLDVETGALRARRTNTWDAVLDVAYGWGGRRIVVAEPSLAAHCQHNPNGGVVTILDPETLATVATAVDLGDYNSPGGYRGGGPVFRASPVDDLVLAVPRIEDGPDVRAFRLSDGGALPAPPITAMPVAFSPDGGSVLMTDGAALERVRVSDGSIVWTTMLGQLGSFGMSADGGVLAFGGAGGQLLRVLRAGDSVPAAVCAADEPSAPVGTPVASSLSSDGQLVALAAPNEIRVVRRGDGAVVTRIPDGLATPPAKVTLSPSARYVVTNAGTASVSSVFRVADGTRAGAFPVDTWNWANFVFSAARGSRLQQRVPECGVRDERDRSGLGRVVRRGRSAAHRRARNLDRLPRALPARDGHVARLRRVRRPAGGRNSGRLRPGGAAGGGSLSDGAHVAIWSRPTSGLVSSSGSCRPARARSRRWHRARRGRVGVCWSFPSPSRPGAAGR